MCCHLPLKLTLGGAKVYIEAAQIYRHLGHNVDLIGIDEIVGSDQPYMNEDWRVLNFPAKLYEFLKQHAHRYDVIEYESIYLPFQIKEQLSCVLVARSVLLDLHLKEIKIPRFRGMKSLAGFLVKSWQRNAKLNNKIQQSLKSISYADFVNVPNPSDKEILIKYGIGVEKIIVQPYGMFEDKIECFDQMRLNSLDKGSKKIIAFVGTFDNRKGAVEFPEVIQKILDTYFDVEFKLIGVLGMFPTVEDIYNYVGAEFRNRVHIVGKYSPEELPILLKDCTYGIFPSYLESFGFGVLEMMAIGIPVVGYDSPGINMLLLPELTVKPGNIDDLLSIFSKLLGNEEFSKECVNRCLLKTKNFIYEKQENYAIQSYQKKIIEKRQSKYKVLTIIYDLDIGGTQRAAQNFAMAYHVNGHDSRVLPVYQGGIRQSELTNMGIKVYSHGDAIDGSIEQIQKWHPDIIHIHRWGEPDSYLSKILRSLKTKHTKVIETNVFSFTDNSLDSSLIDVHCHLSEWCLWKWNLFLKKKSLGIVIPYLVISNNFYKETREKILLHKKKIGLPLDKFIFGRIGQKSPAKFHKYIYIAFDQLYSTRMDVHLLIVGLPSHLQDEIKSLTSFKQGAITLVDCIVGDEELRITYNTMDCFLHFSTIGESFGMVLAEAQLCEVPVISVSTPKRDNSQLEVLLHNESAIILKDQRYLKEVMEKIQDGYYPLAQFGDRGRRHILDTFTPKALIPKLNLLFKILLDEKNVENNISLCFNSNLHRLSIKYLQTLGFGEYSLSNKLFFFMPKLYLLLSEYIAKFRKNMMRGEK